jgi:hypothetical protein
MKTKRFVISWLVSSVIMFLISYIWHGVILNDFKNVNLPHGLFIALCALVYLLIGFLLLILLLFIKLDDAAFFKRILIGGAFGFFIYLVVFTLGKSYIDRGMDHVVIDFTWQMIEQGIGAFVLALSFRAYERMDAIEN